VTPRARAALAAIRDGRRDAVTRQMIDRLSAAHLVDFDPRQGWHLTDAGRAALA
jgi:hypothetical protein